MHKPPSSIPIPYPNSPVRFLLRAPLIAFRLGLGDMLNPLRLLVLTTRGRKSGIPRHAAVEYRRHGSKVYLISAWGARPDWYQNLLVDPLVTIQLGREKVSALADKVSDPAEAARALHLFRRDAPARYDVVLGRLIEDEVSGIKLPDISKQFTIVRLDIIGDEPLLPGLKSDLMWLWAVMLVAVITIIAAVKRAGTDT